MQVVTTPFDFQRAGKTKTLDESSNKKVTDRCNSPDWITHHLLQWEIHPASPFRWPLERIKVCLHELERLFATCISFFHAARLPRSMEISHAGVTYRRTFPLPKMGDDTRRDTLGHQPHTNLISLRTMAIGVNLGRGERGR